MQSGERGIPTSTVGLIIGKVLCTRNGQESIFQMRGGDDYVRMIFDGENLVSLGKIEVI